eukprot:868480_1
MAAYVPAHATTPTSEAPQIIDRGLGVYFFNGEKLIESLSPVITIKNPSGIALRTYKLLLRGAIGAKESQWRMGPLFSKNVELSAINKDFKQIYDDKPLDGSAVSEAIWLKVRRKEETSIPMARQAQPPMIIQKPDGRHYVEFDDASDHGKRKQIEVEKSIWKHPPYNAIKVEKSDGTKTRLFLCEPATPEAATCDMKLTIMIHRPDLKIQRSAATITPDRLNTYLMQWYGSHAYTITILQKSNAFGLFRPSSSSS